MILTLFPKQYIGIRIMENNSFYDYKSEIAERQYIKDKIRNNIKITPEERVWLMTHSVYNQKWGNDTFNVAVEHIEQNKWYVIRVIVESVSYDKRIVPVLSALPAKKGKIVADFEMWNYNGVSVRNKSVKVLGFEFDDNKFEYEVEYFSDLGIISIQYECDYFDSKMNLNRRAHSCSEDPALAMRREIVDVNTIRYYCKSPIDSSFDALVFNVHWEEKI